MNTAKIHEPLAPHADTLAQPECVIEGLSARSERCLVTFCRRSNCGGVYHFDARMWTLWCPIALADFMGSIDAQGFTFTDRESLERWVTAVAGGGKGPAN